MNSTQINRDITNISNITDDYKSLVNKFLTPYLKDIIIDDLIPLICDYYYISCKSCNRIGAFDPICNSCKIMNDTDNSECYKYNTTNINTEVLILEPVEKYPYNDYLVTKLCKSCIEYDYIYTNTINIHYYTDDIKYQRSICIYKPNVRSCIYDQHHSGMCQTLYRLLIAHFNSYIRNLRLEIMECHVNNIPLQDEDIDA